MSFLMPLWPWGSRSSKLVQKKQLQLNQCKQTLHAQRLRKKSSIYLFPQTKKCVSYLPRADATNGYNSMMSPKPYLPIPFWEPFDPAIPCGTVLTVVVVERLMFPVWIQCWDECKITNLPHWIAAEISSYGSASTITHFEGTVQNSLSFPPLLRFSLWGKDGSHMLGFSHRILHMLFSLDEAAKVTLSFVSQRNLSL